MVESLFLLVCLLDLLVQSSCLHTEKTAACTIEDRMADCSHLSLKEVPADLPTDITGLDVSHNMLRALPGPALARYPKLVLLDASSNDITHLESGMCLALPLLRDLILHRNEVHLLIDKDLFNCTNLSLLDLSFNRLKLHGEPFLPLKSLTTLDLSANSLISARLGIVPQLWNLDTLILSKNFIKILKSDDLSFLSNSSIQTLIMSSLPLKTLQPGCFQQIRGLRNLVMDGSVLSPQLTAKLSEELSGTSIASLSLQNIRLVSLTDTIFKGLQDTNLTSLDLSSNSLVSMHNSPFKWLGTLEILSLNESNLKHLTSTSFIGLGNLRFMNLTRALVKSHKSSYPIIDNFSFSPLTRLETLLMDHTAFQGITADLFSGLESLRHLSLSWSSVGLRTVNNGTFASLSRSPLRTLDLTATDILRLDPGAFSGLGNLTKLLLGSNFISQTLIGEEFQGLYNLEELDMYHNKRIILSPLSFNHMRSLRTLILGLALAQNQDFNPSPFQLLHNLSTLDLSNNNIANMMEGLLEGLEKLRVLRLQHNNLQRLWKSAYPGGPVSFLRGLHSLEILDMDSNGLDEIPLTGLSGLAQLRELSLAGNVLDHLRDSIFDDLTSLRFLRLQRNLITLVPPGVFGPALRNLSVLHMERNPFDCTCESILWFVNWLNTTNASVPQRGSEYICNTPPAYFNKSVDQFNTLSCKDMAPFYILYVMNSVLVLVFMVGSLLFHFQGWRIKFHWEVMVNRTLGFAEPGLGEVRFEYDAYLIHAQADSTWVDRHLLPLEEDKQYTFFVDDRDAVPGRSQLESIVEAMRSSRKIVFIVTEKLLNDPWCRMYKAHQAMHQVIEDSRDSVVLVLLEDIPDHRLSRDLLIRKGMLKSHCVLHWPLQKERVQAFRHKLRVALGSSNSVQ
ncbi:toll-like receptor 3 [Conger conger]|uniref:toll-like receptor 3 n=1 Tax=Conger conger TaxID=82655 RepID=UPI002A5A6791|nr:toll-like receptor 3 [Conger conger]XP_061102332.1 toll-like receptor 3 [Conger conger]XP_061102333.1 toll-like receptor 3 [Conger conger]